MNEKKGMNSSSSATKLPALKATLHESTRGTDSKDNHTAYGERSTRLESKQFFRPSSSETARKEVQRNPAAASEGVQGVSDLLKKYPLNAVPNEVYANTFHYLWTKDALNRNPSDAKVPHTVIYRHRQAYAWFFTSKDGSIKRKNKQNLFNSHIEQAFLKAKAPNCDVVAKFVDLSSSKNHQQSSAEPDSR